VFETYGDPVLHLGALGSGLRTKLINNTLNAANFALAHDAMAVGEAFGLDPEQLGVALRHGSGRSYSLEVFVGLGSLDVIAEHAGPLLAKDVGLFRRERGPVPAEAREVMLAAADRFLALVGRPRPEEA
jgi:3-hydroxyisobutyrate dehydrogenase-like beta-hydroxyacid dehydrogenase